LQTSSNHRRTISKIDLDRKCPIQVLFPRGAPFLPELEAELLAFPRGKTDDQVDSISQALAYKPGYNLAALAS